MAATLTVMRDTTLRDIPATLRKLADNIEAGDYGEAVGMAWAVETDGGGRVIVGYSGDGEPGPRAFLLLHTGAAKIMAGVLDELL